MKKPEKVFTDEDVRNALRSRLTYRGAISDLARTLGIQPAYISGVLHGHKRPSGVLLRWLGYRRVLAYALNYSSKGDKL